MHNKAIDIGQIHLQGEGDALHRRMVSSLEQSANIRSKHQRVRPLRINNNNNNMLGLSNNKFRIFLSWFDISPSLPMPDFSELDDSEELDKSEDPCRSLDDVLEEAKENLYYTESE